MAVEHSDVRQGEFARGIRRLSCAAPGPASELILKALEGAFFAAVRADAEPADDTGRRARR
eukprot:9773507-Alexandrium_andersonii.AAC.1